LLKALHETVKDWTNGSDVLKKYRSFEEAIRVMSEKGELQFIGREGRRYEYCIYNYRYKGKLHHLAIKNDGEVCELKDFKP
jgi:hypothetical protein